MSIEFEKYRPKKLLIELNKLNRLQNNKNEISITMIEKTTNLISKQDIEIEDVKKLLYNLKKIKNEERVASILYNLKLRQANKKVENLEEALYFNFLYYYESKFKNQIYNSLVKIGKELYRYMEKSLDDRFKLEFQKIFYSGSNISFFQFLYKDFEKDIETKSFRFFQNYMINYDSEIARDLVKKYEKEHKIKDSIVKVNLEKIKIIIGG